VLLLLLLLALLLQLDLAHILAGTELHLFNSKSKDTLLGK
jgi:hypothetical protein